MSRPQLSICSFGRRTEGSVAIIFAFLIVVLFGLLALAIDMARAYSIASKVQGALDAAALAGAKALDKGLGNAEVVATTNRYFEAHIANLNIADVQFTDFTARIDSHNSAVIANVKSTMATAFAGAIGHKFVNINKSAKVVYKQRRVELAMALDITGSMSDDNKIDDMKAAAKDVLDVIFDDVHDDMSVRVALVPWAATVYAGSFAANVSGNTSLDGCVVERTGTDAATDAAPIGASAIPAITAGPFGPYKCTPNEIMPLSGVSRQADLRGAIESYAPDGRTAGHIGTAWGWYMLSPAWSGIWPSASVPSAYDPKETIKSVLIMTDGKFNTSYKTGTETATTDMTTESYQQFADLCTEMKAPGKRINVYTVGLGLSPGLELDALKACASSTSMFFEATNGSDLKKAFKQIATQIKSMHISN